MRMTAFPLVLIGFYCWAIAHPIQVRAQDAPSSTPKIGLLQSLDLSAGIVNNQNRNASPKWNGFYNLQINQKQVLKHGDAFSAVDTTGRFANKPEQDANTNNPFDFSLNLTQGQGKTSGTLIDLLALTPLQKFKVPVGGLERFRTEFQAGGAYNLSPYYLGAGLDTPSITLSPRHNLHLANWLIFGTNALVSRQPGESAKASGVATYRLFIGQAQGWKVSASRQAPFTLQQVLDLAPGPDTTDGVVLNDFLQQADKIGQKPTSDQTEFDAFVILQARDLNSLLNPPPGQDGVVGAPTPGQLRAPGHFRLYITDAYNASMGIYRQEPSTAVWLESSGWYTYAGDAQGNRWKPTVQAIGRYSWDMGTKRSYSQIGWINGYDRAAPTDRLNEIRLTIGILY